MKTIELTKEEIAARVSLYENLKPLAIQLNDKIPLGAKDLIYSRKLLSVIGLEGQANTPINQNAPIRGAAGITMTLAVCPAGTGPSLHSHHKTYETFTVLQGKFEIRVNDEGSEKVILEQFDTISVPPLVNRCFRNVGDQEGILQVLISGGVHDMHDIEMAPSVGEAMDRYGQEVKQSFSAFGFNAHMNAED